MSKFDGLINAKRKKTDKKKASVAVQPNHTQEVSTLAGNTQKITKIKSRGKRSDPDYTQITAYVRKETHETVMRKIYKRQELSELVEELLTDWIERS